MNPKKIKNRPKQRNHIRVYRSDTSSTKQDKKEEFDKKSGPTLKVTVLGGNEEVGRNMTVLEYGKDIMEPQLRPEFIEKMKRREKESTIEIKDFKKHFGLN